MEGLKTTSGLLAVAALGVVAGMILVALFGAETPVEDIDHHVRVVYDVTNGVRVQADKTANVRKIPCFDGDPSRNCIWLSCPACQDCAADEPIPESSEEPTG